MSPCAGVAIFLDVEGAAVICWGRSPYRARWEIRRVRPRPCDAHERGLNQATS